MRTYIANLNGVGIAYLMGLFNAGMAAANAFGLQLSPGQTSALAGLMNALLIAVLHINYVRKKNQT